MRLALLLLLCFASPASMAEGILDKMSSLGSAKQPVFLPADEAFGSQVVVRDAHTLQASFRITPGYYLYRDKVAFAIKDGAVKITAVNLPKGEMKRDPNFGDTEVFHQSFQAEITLQRDAASAGNIILDAVYQGCSEQGLCYPPITKTLRINLPDIKTGQPAPPVMAEAPPPSAEPEGSQIAKLFKGGNFWLIVSFFFGAGLLLSLTPCVFPMIPILSGIFF